MSTLKRQAASVGGTSGASEVWKAAVVEAAVEAEPEAVPEAEALAAVAAAAGAMRTARTVNQAQQRVVKVSAAPTEETRHGPRQACLPEETLSLRATALPLLGFNGRERDDGEMEKTIWAPLGTRESRGRPTGGLPPAGSRRQAEEVPTAPVAGATAQERS